MPLSAKIRSGLVYGVLLEMSELEGVRVCVARYQVGSDELARVMTLRAFANWAEPNKRWLCSKGGHVDSKRHL